MCGLTTPERGTVSIDGQPLGGDTDPGKRKIGLVPQDLALYEELSARENLRFFGALYGLRGADARRRDRHPRSSSSASPTARRIA